ncbi:alpha/beta fold hydrolase [Halocynthiibacter sp.]|uniref:alpha/beta fold hydrolase n=1 Tax=Halocynthiibacter sp. TaxID=1979210 RepID=UPI003C3B94E3
MLWFSILILPVLGVAVFPFVREALRPDVAQVRAKTNRPGQLSALPSGKTWYNWDGPADGPVAVCVHGLSTPSFVWGAAVEALTDQGFRVLTYDLYGRGLSDRASGEQSVDFHLRQLNELLTDQKVADGFTLLGYSMGGAIVTCFAARFPGRLKQAVIIAPAGLGHDLGGTSAYVTKHPGFIANWLMQTRGAAELREGIRSEAAGFISAVPDIWDLQAEELTVKGYIPAITSSLQYFLRGDLRAEHETIREAGLPLLAIWGESDTVIPIECRDTLVGINPHATQVTIPDAPHGLTYTHPGDLGAALKSLTV